MRIELNAIEKEWRRQVRIRARRVAHRPNVLLNGLIAALVTPSVICVAFFVPLVGQLLFVGNLALAASYVFIKRSLLLGASLVGGVALGISLMALVANLFSRNAAPFYYLLMAFSMFISIVTFLMLLGRIWVHYDQGRVADSSVGESLEATARKEEKAAA
jgi:hypothetical protein